MFIPPCNWVTEWRHPLVVFNRAGDDTGAFDMEEKRKKKDLKLAYLICWQVWLLNSQGMPVGVGARITECVGRNSEEECLYDLLEIEADRTGRPHHMGLLQNGG